MKIEVVYLQRQRLIFLSIFLMIIVTVQLLQPSTEVLKYFPIDEDASFSQLSTSLNFQESIDNQSQLIWKIESRHDQPAYLSQDVGLLYENGKLKGIQSKWRQDQKELKQSIDFKPKSDSLYQTISYHHLELHQESNPISSQHQMTEAQLYVFPKSNSSILSFNYPRTDNEKRSADHLDEEILKYLNQTWSELMDDYEIKRDLYYQIPLINLTNYQETPLANMSMTDTRRIIAQLWEGLYKNYILPNRQVELIEPSVIPLILLDKDLDHLIVLFTDHNGDNQQLFQQLNIK